MNTLYYGDCLTIMKNMMKANSVDLIYLDPPFNSNRAYNAIYKDETGRPLPDQIEAFCDLWTLDQDREDQIRELPITMRDHDVDDSVVEFWITWVKALRHTHPKLLAYLSYMVERLLEMKIMLKPTGSIYLHCDPTCGHYIKVMMDGVFGHENFRNEIIWHYGKWTNEARAFQRNHDTILFYSKSDVHTFNKLFQLSKDKEKKLKVGYQVNRPSGVKQLIVYDRHKAIRKIREGNYDAIVYKDDDEPGVAMHDVWSDINILNSQAKERLGYPTQKPLALLERIIKASSNEGDVVLDPFCGCGTTLEAAHNLKRKWIGIDIAIHAIKRVSAFRLKDRCNLDAGTDYEITGIPSNEEGAEELWTKDPYHFQKWAIETIDGFSSVKRSSDGGIDGRIYFEVSGMADLESMALEVKGGENVTIANLRAFHGSLIADGALLGGFIVRKPITGQKKHNFDKFMRQVGTEIIDGRTYPKLQMLSVPEILEGRRFNMPLPLGRTPSLQGELDLTQ